MVVQYLHTAKTKMAHPENIDRNRESIKHLVADSQNFQLVATLHRTGRTIGTPKLHHNRETNMRDTAQTHTTKTKCDEHMERAAIPT